MSTVQGATAAGDDAASTGRTGTKQRRAGAFDIRTFIATLLGIYGLVLVAMGLFSTSDTDLNRADGINVNLWAGLAMVIAAAVLVTWARLRPLAVPANIDTDDAEEDRPPVH
jgi:uncharacterized membrane protein